MSPSTTPPRPNEDDRLLKRGAGVETYLHRPEDGDAAVVKRLLWEAAFERDLRLLAPLGVTVAVDREQLWVSRPYIAGQTLAESRGSDVDRVIAIASGVVADLVVAHELGVLHRDIKPSNIVVDGSGGGARLVDFCAYRRAWLDPAMRDDTIVSARYVSPERAGTIDAVVDERADLYSLGVVLYECLAGRPPFEGSTVAEILRAHVTSGTRDVRDLGIAVPRPLAELIARLIEVQPDERYRSARAVLTDLEAIAEARSEGRAETAVAIGQADRRQALADPAFVGRDSELAILRDALTDARGGAGTVAALEGDSGGGKSRLLDELARLARSEGWWVARGNAVDQVGQRPFQLFDGVVSAIIDRSDSDAAFAEELRTTLEEDAGSLLTVLPQLMRIIGSAAPSVLPEEFAEQRSIRALGLLLDRLGSETRPALVLLDDCQWAETASAKMLLQWSQQSTGGRRHVLVVTAFRSEEVGPSSPLRGFPTNVRLRPFADADVRRVVQSMAGPCPDLAIETVVRLAEGSPFMAAAVLRGMVECGALQPGALQPGAPGAPDKQGAPGAAQPAPGWVVDESALALARTSDHAAAFLVRRLELLSAPALELLAAAAVLGKAFDLGTATRLSGLSVETAGAATDAARARHILSIDTRTSRGSFLHDKLREAVLERLDETARAELHRRTAVMLQAEDASIFDLAYHFDAAGCGAEALPYARTAAEQARSQHALESAETYYGIAWRASADAPVETRAEIAEGLADVLALRGRYRHADELLSAALEMAPGPRERARLEGKRGEVAFRRGDHARACADMEGALRSTGRWVPRNTVGYAFGLVWELLVQVAHCLLPNRVIVRKRELDDDQRFALHLYSRLAYAYWFRSGRVPCAWTHLREMNIAERHPPSLELAQAYSEHAPVMTMLPWYSRGIRYVQRSLEIRRAKGDVWGQGQSLSFYAVVLYAAGRYVDCIDAVTEAMRLLARTGDQWEINTATWHLAFAHYRLGHLDQAARVSEALHRDALSIGDHMSAGIALSSWARATDGDVPPDVISDALARLGDCEDVHTQAEIRLASAICLLADHSPTEAASVLREAWAAVRRAGLRQEYVAPVLPWLATILRAQLDAMAPDDPRRAQVAKERSRVARQAGRLSRWYANNRPHALRELAYLQAGRGHLRAARRLLTESIATAERQGADHELAESREARGQIGRRVGWPDAAQDLAVAEGLRLPHTPESGTARPATLSLADRFDGLVESGRAIAAATSPATIRDETKRAASLLLRGDRCGVVDLNDDDAEIDPAVIAMVKLAVSSGRPVSGNTAGSLLCAPINVDGRPVACLYAAHDTIPGLFAEEEEQVASFLTTLAGAALEHAADSQARFRALIQNASDVIAIVDAEGHVSYISPSVKRITGFAPEDVVGRDLTMLAPSARDQMSEALTTALQDALARPMVEVLALGADGAPVHLQLTYTNLFSTPSISGIVVNAHDVTERRRADAAASMFQIAFESAPIGMAMTSVRPDRAGTFLRVNEALADMLGYERSELEGINIRDLTHPDDQGADSDALARMASGASVSHEVEKRYRHADGRWVWVHLKASVVFDGPDPDFAISQMVDITEQRAVAEQLIHQALHDPLTGLPNRRLLHERLNRALLASNRRGRQLAVLYLDLDRFKGVNDSFGHEVGDQVLVEVTARLSRLLRSSDTLARLGGDEFVIVLEDVHSHQDVDDVVDRIHAVLNQPVRLSTGGEASIATSVGIAFAELGDDPETLLRDADTALYSAKEDGRARSAVFNESLRTRIVGRMDAERDLREAMAADRLELRYQPIVDLGTGHTVGAEALVRYRDGNGRLVRPSEFIDIAEETGLIIPLGAWVLRAACVQLSRWRVGHGLDDFRLTVNVSPRQIAAPDFVELVEQTLRETGVPASSLAIEVTEGRLLEAEASRPKLRQLQRLGCEVGIDDFGTGYSCLAYLRELPIDFVKIDQSFVDGVATDPARGAMIGAIVELMAALGLRAVVEGVETPEQWASLRTLGCTYGQGYVFGNPKTSEDFLRFLPDAA